MNKLIALILLFGCGVTQAALVDRGGGFIYDDVLNVTWLQDANYANTSGFSLVSGGFYTDGRMEWDTAMAWVDWLSVFDSVRGVIYDDWRLPTSLQPDPSCSSQSGGYSLGFGCTGSEMGHLRYLDGISFATPGLFKNIKNGYYWTGTEIYGGGGAVYAYSMYGGAQAGWAETYSFYAWAVRDGDVAASVVPIPAAVWLFGSGLTLLGWLRRKQISSIS